MITKDISISILGKDKKINVMDDTATATQIVQRIIDDQKQVIVDGTKNIPHNELIKLSVKKRLQTIKRKIREEELRFLNA